ncbi:MAG: leucine-rich repeat domain-containing protein [Defluviitaleaceae bacterium]|nr:leucine-rich repeat domain-containing protein [Defluviitaleaceae bacterium]
MIKRITITVSLFIVIFLFSASDSIHSSPRPLTGFGIEFAGEDLNVILTGLDIIDVSFTQFIDGLYDLRIDFTPYGAARLAEATRHMAGQWLGLYISGEFNAGLLIRGEVSNGTLVFCEQTRWMAEYLDRHIRAGMVDPSRQYGFSIMRAADGVHYQFGSGMIYAVTEAVSSNEITGNYYRVIVTLTPEGELIFNRHLARQYLYFSIDGAIFAYIYADDLIYPFNRLNFIFSKQDQAAALAYSLRTHIEPPGNIAWRFERVQDWHETAYFLHLEGYGRMESFHPGTSPAFAYRETLIAVHIDDRITSIGSFAFFDMPRLEAIYGGSGITRIGERAFAQNRSLQGWIPRTNAGTSHQIRLTNTITHIAANAFQGVPRLSFNVDRNSVAHEFALSGGYDFVVYNAVIEYAQFLFDTLAQGGPPGERYRDFQHFANSAIAVINLLDNNLNRQAGRVARHDFNVSLASAIASVPVSVAITVATKGVTAPTLLDGAISLLDASLTIASLAQTPTTLRSTDEWVFNQGRSASTQARNAVWDLWDMHDDIAQWNRGQIPNEQIAVDYIEAYYRLVTGVSVLRMSTEFFEARRSFSAGWRGAQEVLVNMQRDFARGFTEQIALLVGVDDTIAMALSLVSPLTYSRIIAEAQYIAFANMANAEVDAHLQTAFNRFLHDMNMMNMQTDAWLNGVHVNPGWYDRLFITLRAFIR